MKQLEQESNEAYAAFLAYINTGGTSITSAYKFFMGNTDDSETVLVPDQWYIWSNKFKWDDRLQDLEDDEKDLSEKDLAAKQQERLLDFHNRQIKLNQELSKTVRVLLKRVRAAIARLDPETIPPGQIPNFINSVSRIAELSIKQESDQLAITELIDALKSMQEKSSTPEEKKFKIEPVKFNFEKVK